MEDNQTDAITNYREIQHRIAENLRRLRKSKRLSQEKLSAISDVDRSYIGYIENSKNNVSVKILWELSVAMGCDVSDFFAPIVNDDINVSE